MCALLGTTEKVVRIISRGQVYEQVYLSQTPGTSLGDHQRNLESGLLKIYATALELLAESGKLFSQNTARRTLEAIINPGKSVGALAEIAEQEDDLLRDVQVCETKRSSDSDKRVIEMLETFNDPIFRIDKGVNKVLKYLDDSERIEILEWISSIRFGKHHDTIRGQRTPNTGDWLLQHDDFRSWEMKKTSSLFWLQGSAGTGKTYLTSSVVDRVRTMLSGSLEVEGLAFFYCNRSEPQRGRSENILQSFVRQLCTPAQRPEHMQGRIKKAYEDARDRGTDFQTDQCMELIQECLDGYGRTTLIVDALDECDRRSQSSIIKALNSFLANSKNPVKIFISSRPDSDIRNRLKDSPTIAVSASSNQRDIKLYLEAELQEMANDQTFLNAGTVKQTAIERLLQRCQGMFQWAALQIKQLVDYRSKASFIKRLDDLPEGIQAAYDEVWNYIEALDEPDKTFAKRALLWTMSTHKPFSSSELLSAIRIDSNGDMVPLEDQLDEQALLSLCKNFLTIDTRSDVWRFTHLSVVEYLETKEGWSHPKVHYHAASACLSYFINTYDRDFAELPPQTFDLDTDKAVESKDIVDAGKEVDPADLEESDDGFGRYHPFHIYMRQCWMHHVREADDTKDKNLATLLKKFLGSPEESSSQYRKWFNVLYKDGWFFFKTTRDATWFYETRHFGSASAGDVIHDIFDEKFAIFGVCRMGLENIASEWLDGANFDVSRVNIRGHSLLALAAMAGSVPICKRLVGSGANVNQRLETNRRFGSALQTAVSLKNTDVVDYLLDVDADINLLVETENSDHSSPLSAAVTEWDIEMTKLLLQKGRADFNMGYPEIENDNILVKAYRQDCRMSGLGETSLEFVKLMLKAGADVNTTFASETENKGLLPEMIARSDVEGVKYLLEETEVDIQKRHGEDGLYPIEIAVEDFNGEARLEVLRLLCEAGADVNSFSSNGRHGSVLAGACSPHRYLAMDNGKENPKAVAIVLNAGAVVDKQLTHGEYGSALAVAAKESQGTEILQLLLDAGADVNMPLENGSYGSAILAAQEDDSDDYEKVKFLLLAEANLESGLKPEALRAGLAAFVLANNAERVKAIIKAGAETSVRLDDPDFDSILSYSTILDFEEGILQALVDGGATKTSHHSTARYRSALIAASCFGQYQAVEYLINAGVAVEDEHSGDYTTAIEAAEAPFSEADRACIVKFCKSNEAEAEALLETWGKQKGNVLELLKKALPPPEVIEDRKSKTIFKTIPISSTCRTVVCQGETFEGTGDPYITYVGPKRLRSGNYTV
ncbi:hypothetical protein N7541_007756 [Penicillium brevicompactum]|uniref:Nephrocystin 3-like N-terminal domain-containing protein n=1 Tax=Penicillium brevicompactum TaxID=5074 RepID=A0A9W9R0S4_PENBR|nr:hypothetical protein N7541_007756 [Penicillium brevicompactum]